MSIEYHPTGTVEVTVDDETYKLGRPKLRQWRYFTRQLDEMLTEAQETLRELSGAALGARDAYEADPSDENRKAQEATAKQLNEFSQTPFYERSSLILQEMFKQLGNKPLPEDIDDWPAWLAADVSLPNQILGHWRKAPKASGIDGSQ
jgi:hypothetical protein